MLRYEHGCAADEYFEELDQREREFTGKSDATFSILIAYTHLHFTGQYISSMSCSMEMSRGLHEYTFSAVRTSLGSQLPRDC